MRQKFFNIVLLTGLATFSSTPPSLAESTRYLSSYENWHVSVTADHQRGWSCMMMNKASGSPMAIIGDSISPTSFIFSDPAWSLPAGAGSVKLQVDSNKIYTLSARNLSSGLSIPLDFDEPGVAQTVALMADGTTLKVAPETQWNRVLVIPLGGFNTALGDFSVCLKQLAGPPDK